MKENDPDDSLQKNLIAIQKIISFKRIFAKDSEGTAVKSYFNFTHYLYRFFHSKEGAMHLPLYRADKKNHHSEALLEQAGFVSNQISTTEAKSILEIGSGLGFNSIHLAKLHPKVNFKGLDLNPFHIRQSAKKSRDLSNIQFQKGDFQQLNFPPQCFDMVFAVESFCYTRDLRRVLQGIYKVLKPNGKFLLFDVFIPDKTQKPDKDSDLALKLSAWGFAVQQWILLADLKRTSQEIGFEISEIQDCSEAAMPNLLTFQKGMRRLFQYPFLIKFFLQSGIFPLSIFKHTVAGLLAASVLQKQYLGYYQLLLKKN